MEFNDFQKIKRKFFSYRNGITADALRKGGSPFKIIFGLTLPQLSEIARETGFNENLSRKLWKDISTRCSMLIAPQIMPREKFAIQEALEWCSEVPSYEVADVLCLKLLSNVNYQKELIPMLLTGSRMDRYIALRMILKKLKNREERETWRAFVIESNIIDNSEFPLLEVQIKEELEND